MWRRLPHCIVATALALVAASVVIAAEQSGKVYRIGWLLPGSPPSNAEASGGEMQKALRDAGYVEGANLAIVYRYANDKVERLPDLAAELARLPLDVLVTSGEPAALAAKRATNAMPIVAIE